MMKLRSILCLLCFLFVESLAQQVNTPDGPIKGIMEYTNNRKVYYSYYSIPYAKPPTGARRFLAPEPIDPWTRVYDASKEKTNICYQLSTDSTTETEDCLYMNVFTPQSPTTSGSTLPVMVNIHLGSFTDGYGSIGPGGISPKYLIEENVIVVSFNYRLGAFGFLSTGDRVIPGNAGFKDQILALKWVQKNIAAFGGDPKKVTILGQSAGAASVGYMILSPAAKGLFAAGVMESGTSLSPWAYQRNQTKISYKIASFVDSGIDSSTSSAELLQILQKAPARTIDSASQEYVVWDAAQPAWVQRMTPQQGSYFTPVVDAAADDPVLPDLQYETLASGNINNVPILIGICSEEGLINLNEYMDYALEGYDQDPASLNPQDLHIDDQSSWNAVGKLIKQKYSPSATFMRNKLAGIKYFTDHDYAKPAVKHAELQSTKNDVYFYQFSYSGVFGYNTDHRYPGSGNVTHVEEWTYLYWGYPVASYSQSDQLVHNRLVRLWTNFAKSHNPTPTKDTLLQNIVWPKIQSGNFQYVNIGNFSNPALTVVKGKPKSDGMTFWEDIYTKYGQRPFDTY